MVAPAHKGCHTGPGLKRTAGHVCHAHHCLSCNGLGIDLVEDDEDKKAGGGQLDASPQPSLVHCSNLLGHGREPYDASGKKGTQRVGGLFLARLGMLLMPHDYMSHAA